MVFTGFMIFMTISSFCSNITQTQGVYSIVLILFRKKNFFFGNIVLQAFLFIVAKLSLYRCIRFTFGSVNFELGNCFNWFL